MSTEQLIKLKKCFSSLLAFDLHLIPLWCNYVRSIALLLENRFQFTQLCLADLDMYTILKSDFIKNRDRMNIKDNEPSSVIVSQ